MMNPPTGSLWKQGDSSDDSDDKDPTSRDKDFIMAHLIRMAVSSKSTLESELSNIVSDLIDLEVISEDVGRLVIDPSNLYTSSFFHEKEDDFWLPVMDLSINIHCRYLNDYVPDRILGEGGFGYVVLCKNKLDGQYYAVKKIPFPRSYDIARCHSSSSITREVMTLSNVQHKHVVRYYNAWIENGVKEPENVMFPDGEDPVTLIPSGSEGLYLHIAMEYCPSSLRTLLEKPIDELLKIQLFHQIVVAVAYLHDQCIVHGDLNPNNIFLDSEYNVKIGDFGLAKIFPQDGSSGGEESSPVGSGTQLYKAPETDVGFKADIYSLGVIYFEISYHFTTGMERKIVLEKLKDETVFPDLWDEIFPKKAELVKRLMSDSPFDRPSAKDLLLSMDSGTDDVVVGLTTIALGLQERA